MEIVEVAEFDIEVVLDWLDSIQDSKEFSSIWSNDDNDLKTRLRQACKTSRTNFVEKFHPDYLTDDEWVTGVSISKYEELYNELERIKNA